jgi:2-polyprenyl-6-methoxyphenol hydroxylase-like FAD-dependent oxidoreductase
LQSKQINKAMNHLLEHKKVAIIGGGPGGLTLANLLQQKGIAVKVYERDANQYTRQQGATLDLHHESGLKALSKAGLLDEFKKHYRIGADKLCITNAQATPLWDDHQDEVIADFGNEDFRPEIDRGPLRDILIEALLPETIIWNSHFENFNL